MTNNAVLDICIGLIFVYCLYSLLATTISEIVTSIIRLRSRMFKRVIRLMLTDNKPGNSLVDDFFKHELIKYMNKSASDTRAPSYLSAGNFSKTLMDIIKRKGDNAGKPQLQQIMYGLEKLKEVEGVAETYTLLRSFLEDANNDLDKFRAKIELWYDDTMERASGWYKRQSQWNIFVIGFSIAVCFNVNTIEIVTKLEKDPKLREQLVVQADVFVKAHPNLSDDITRSKALLAEMSENTQKNQPRQNPDAAISAADSLKRSIAFYEALKIQQDSLVIAANTLVKGDIQKANGILAIGWKSSKIGDFGDFLMALLGWLLTALAISLGAPFWFDLLSKFIQLRGSGTKPGTAAQTDSAATIPNMQRKG
jgi:hypothetical protein